MTPTTKYENRKKNTEKHDRNPLDRCGFVMLCTAVFIKPACLAGITWLRPVDTAIDMLRIALVVYLAAVFLKKMNRVKVNRVMWTALLIFASSVWEVMSSAINGIGPGDWGLLLNGIGILLFSYMAVTADRGTFLDGLSKVLGCYVVLNTLSVIMFPGGMYESAKYKENYFLDYRTAWFPIYLMAAAAVLLYSCEKKTQESRIRAALVIICEYISMLMVWTATGLSCITLGGLFLVFWTKKDKDAPQAAKVMLAQAALFYAFIIKRMQVYLSFFIVNVLNKDVTFTERTRIWDNALYFIKRNMLFGVGKRNAAGMRQMLRYGASHPHCMYLHVMLCFGLIGMILYLASVFTAFGGKTKPEKRAENRIFTAALIAMLTAGQVESFSATGAYLYPLFILSSGIREPDIKKEKEKKIYGRISRPVQNGQLRDKTAGVRHAGVPEQPGDKK